MGGSNPDEGYSLAIAPNGDVYVTGNTTSGHFPATEGAYDMFANGYYGNYSDAFISRLDANLSASFTLTVTKSGTGTGTVTSNPSGINCGSDCTEKYAFNTLVILTAIPDNDSTFTGWFEDCDGTGKVKMEVN